MPARAPTAVALPHPHPLAGRPRRPSLEDALVARRRDLQQLAAGLQGAGAQGELQGGGLQGGELQTRGAGAAEGGGMSREMMVALAANPNP